MDQLSAMTIFVRVVESGSLSGAARAVHTSLTSVSRQIAWLESHYATQLLVRTTRRLALTDDGRLFYERARAVLSEMREMETALSSSGQQLRGRLRMSAPSLMGRLLIAPVLPDFLRRHPQLSLDLLLLDRPVDLLAEDIHVALRIGRLPDSQLIARRLGELTMVVCAAPDYLDQRGEPQSPRELVGHDCLVFSDTPGAADWRFRGPNGIEEKVHVSGRLWSNSLDSLMLAATAGLGLARVPSWPVKHATETGRLRRILTAYELPPAPVQLVFPPARLGAPKTRALVDHLAACWRSSGEL